MTETLGSAVVSTKQQQIAELAGKMPEKALSSLAHHMDLDWMREAYRRTRKDGAVGIDGQTSADYAEHLEDNLLGLLDRAKSGERYRAPPVLRVYIPKGDGSERPLGIPTFEDKVLQRAVVMVLEPLYERDFLDCSYGFRPGRSAHQALSEIQSRLMRMGGGWVLDVDIRKFFDSLSHDHLREILARRMQDGVIKRLIGKWLQAGVMEEGVLTHFDVGTPQGGVVSPLLANIYLHEVLDVWFDQVVIPLLHGQAFLVRYADDFVMGFSNERDARRVMSVLPKRLDRYGLTIHPDKTRLVYFRPPRVQPDPGEKAGSFNFLGFTHYWARSRKGRWVVKQKTAKDRFTKALKRIKEWCRHNRHLSVGDQWVVLTQKVKGHYGYYGVIGNSANLGRFRNEVGRLWHKWLSRRSQQARLDWPTFQRLLKRYPLPPPHPIRSVYYSAAKP